MTEENKQLMLTWKRKKHFDADKCGIKGCTKNADGYVCDIKPTKGGKQGRLWFGPVCTKCVRTKHPTLKPMTLGELAHQRNGVSDLAMVLDIEVGEMKQRLEDAGIDAEGNVIVNVQGGEAQTNLAMSEEQIAASGGGLVQVEAPQPEQPQGPPPQAPNVPTGSTDIVIVQTQSITVPVKELSQSYQETNEALLYLGTFQIVDQPTMDTAASWLKMVKQKWNALDEQRKAIVRPWQAKVAEVQDYFREPLTALHEAEKLLKAAITEGSRRLEEAQQRALEAAQQALQAGNTGAMAQATQAAAQADVVLPQGLSNRAPKIHYRIVNKALVPTDLWDVSDLLVKGAIARGIRQIPGIEIWEEPVLAVTGVAQ